MNQQTIFCTCCGSVLTLEENENVRECPACGTCNTRPKVTGDVLTTLQRATEQRVACDFHNAEESYQQVLLQQPDEYEALWGRLLCRYGVEYVLDPATKRYMPTVHAVRIKPMQEEADFHKACALAPRMVSAQYAQDARYIDDAQVAIRQQAKSFEAYDVFICHKTTKPGSMEKTEDYVRAMQLTHFLKERGMKVFFAPECLPTAAGADYEAGIYHALHTAKVMLVICSRADYLTSAWVRSEWSRYLEIVDEAADKQIIPLFYDRFAPAELPQAFIYRRIQGIDMSDISAPQTLVNVVTAALGEPKQPESQEQKPAAAKPAKARPAPSSDAVIIELPEAHPTWKEYPEMVVRTSGGKFPITREQWGTTISIPIKQRNQPNEEVVFTNKSISVRNNVLLAIVPVVGAFVLLSQHDMFGSYVILVVLLTLIALFNCIAQIVPISQKLVARRDRLFIRPGVPCKLKWISNLQGNLVIDPAE